MGPQRTAAPVKQLLLATITGGADDKVIALGVHIQPANLLLHAAEISLIFRTQGAAQLLLLAPHGLLCSGHMRL